MPGAIHVQISAEFRPKSGENLLSRKNVFKSPVVQILYHLISDNDRILGPPPAGHIFQDTKLDRQTIPSLDRKSTRLNSSHQIISYAVFCLKKKKTIK